MGIKLLLSILRVKLLVWRIRFLTRRVVEQCATLMGSLLLARLLRLGMTAVKTPLFIAELVMLIVPLIIVMKRASLTFRLLARLNKFVRLGLGLWSVRMMEFFT